MPQAVVTVESFANFIHISSEFYIFDIMIIYFIMLIALIVGLFITCINIEFEELQDRIKVLENKLNDLIKND